MATCKACGELKSLQCFYVSNRSTCKDCVKSRVRANRLAKIEYYRAYDRARGNRQPPGYAKEYCEKYPERIKASTARFRENNPEKYLAHNAVNNAVRDGKLIKAPCMICGRENNVHGHHDNYSRPLEVVWLCPPHHFETHKTLAAF